MFSVELRCPAEEKDLLIAELWELGTAGITELSDTQLQAFFHHAPRSLHAALARYGAVWQAVAERDWIGVAQAMLPPMLVGERFFLIPEWRDDPTPPGRFRIAVNPGMAFGTGFHETTQLCLEALERHVEPGMTVLDAGTGSGILAQAAKLLGAGVACGCDIDAAAVEIASCHIPVFLGSPEAVAAGAMDLVVANINPATLIYLAPDIRRVLRQGAIALLSGFEPGDLPAMQQMLGPGRICHKGNWSLLEHRAS
jgi:ribosomal protein L11 methyltransferase